MMPEPVGHWLIEHQVAVSRPAQPQTVLAPVGWLWSHRYVPWWLIWFGQSSWAIRTCHSAYPDHVCACGAYRLVWKEFRKEDVVP